METNFQWPFWVFDMTQFSNVNEKYWKFIFSQSGPFNFTILPLSHPLSIDFYFWGLWEILAGKFLGMCLTFPIPFTKIKVNIRYRYSNEIWILSYNPCPLFNVIFLPYFVVVIKSCSYHSEVEFAKRRIFTKCKYEIWYDIETRN